MTMKRYFSEIVPFLVMFTLITTSCSKNIPEIEENVDEVQAQNVTFTPCVQSKAKLAHSNSDIVVEFTNEGVQIMYPNFEVTCDFSGVDVTHTFVNGFLNITQKATPNKADCVCYTDVSYTIKDVSQKDVNVIFINGVQVYCHTGNEKDDIKLLEIRTGNHGRYTKFEYDEQNRITQIISANSNGTLSTNTITYEGDDLVQDRNYEYIKNENTITLKHKGSNRVSTVELNSDGLPVTWTEEKPFPTHISIVTYFKYSDGNLTERRDVEYYSDDDWDTEWNDYRYNNQKGALYDCKTPKWYLIMFLNQFGVKNNITYHEYWGNNTKYDYEFDDAGFPVKRTCTNDRMMGADGLEVWEEKYTYITK